MVLHSLDYVGSLERSGLESLAVKNQLDPDEQSHSSNVTDQRVRALEPLEPAHQSLADDHCVVLKVVVFYCVQNGHANSTRNRVAAESVVVLHAIVKRCRYFWS